MSGQGLDFGSAAALHEVRAARAETVEVDTTTRRLRARRTDGA